MVAGQDYVASELDGEEAGGFVVLNVAGPGPRPNQICEDDGSAYFSTLAEARRACRRLRRESGNSEIYVYALVGVRDAVQQRASVLAVA